MSLTCDCGKALTSRSGYYSHIKKCTVKEQILSLKKELAETKRKLACFENQTLSNHRHNFGKEDTSSITDSVRAQCALSGYKGLMRLCIHIYFAIPSNMTVKYSEEKGTIYEWYNDYNGFCLRNDKYNTLSEMLEKAYAIQYTTWQSLKETHTDERISQWYDGRSKYSYKQQQKKLQNCLDAFIEDFYTRRPVDDKVLLGMLKL